MMRIGAAQMLYNTYRAYTEADIVTGSDTLAAYSDRDKISDWAEDAAAFVIENEVMRGVSKTLHERRRKRTLLY